MLFHIVCLSTETQILWL